eukprot:4324058-Pyramimonas_sp.AAC.1
MSELPCSSQGTPAESSMPPTAAKMPRLAPLGPWAQHRPAASAPLPPSWRGSAARASQGPPLHWRASCALAPSSVASGASSQRGQ